MAEIAGFRGLLFDPTRVEISKVLAPPYDVIDEAGRAALIAQHDKNCVSIVLPKASADQEPDAKYQNAQELLGQWLEEGTLVRDEKPAIYRYHQVYKHAELGEQEVTRRGFIAAVRLHDFAERVILRHERTLKGPKVDRLKLWETTSTHLSQIFTLYSDPKGAIDSFFCQAEEQGPDIDGTTADGTRHILWRVTDEAVIAKVSSALDGKSLYIADGHHRYETMLAFREKMRDKKQSVSPRSSAQFGMMFLANIDDPGLVVLPTHRMIHSVADFSEDSLKASLAEYFHVVTLPQGAVDAGKLRHALAKAGTQGVSFAAIFPKHSDALVLTLRDDVDLAAAGVTGAPVTMALDVTLLHGIVLEKILGIDRAAQEAQSSIFYIKDTQSALDRCAAGEGQVCFMMNATTVEQVVAVSDADEVMPQKSTFFYPKIATGMVFNPVSINETL